MMKILVSALEESSNLHLSELRKHLEDVDFIGIYEFIDEDGKYTRGIYTKRDFSVMGFVGVIRKFLFFRKAFSQMVALADKADQILLLDSSSFHIRLGKAIKKKYPNKRISYYILPQVWAWKSWRIKPLKKYFDNLYGILPFEIPLYDGKATYIGHPLLDEITKQKQSPSREGSIVFMPGSRKGEIEKIFPIFCELVEHFKDHRCVLVLPSYHRYSNLFFIQACYGRGVEKFELSFDAQEALYEAKFAFICSGTATLQSAIIGTPFVLCYKAKKFDEWIARCFLKITHIGLANILSLKSGKEEMHKELIQEDCTAEKMLQAYREMDCEKFFTQAKELKEYLQFGSSKNLAREIMK